MNFPHPTPKRPPTQRRTTATTHSTRTRTPTHHHPCDAYTEAKANHLTHTHAHTREQAKAPGERGPFGFTRLPNGEFHHTGYVDVCLRGEGAREDVDEVFPGQWRDRKIGTAEGLGRFIVYAVMQRSERKGGGKTAMVHPASYPYASPFLLSIPPNHTNFESLSSSLLT